VARTINKFRRNLFIGPNGPDQVPPELNNKAKRPELIYRAQWSRCSSGTCLQVLEPRSSSVTFL